MAPLAIGLLSKDRMSMRPSRIKGIEQLRAILKKAKAMEEA